MPQEVQVQPVNKVNLQSLIIWRTGLSITISLDIPKLVLGSKNILCNEEHKFPHRVLMSKELVKMTVKAVNFRALAAVKLPNSVGNCLRLDTVFKLT